MPVCARKHRSVLRRSLFFFCSLGILLTGLVGLRAFVPLEFRDEILHWSATYDLDPAWVASVIRCESNYQQDAISSAGAVGLMQVMPATATWIAQQLQWANYDNINLQDVKTNLSLGTWYLRYLLNRLGSMDTALMAYNAGPTYADRWGGKLDLAFSETRQYIRRVHLFLPIYHVYFRALWLVDLIPSVPLFH